jgi:hypothetical protein
MEPPAVDPAWLVHAKLAFASLCGGMLRLFFRPAASFLKSIWLLFGCVTCGFYGTPVVRDWGAFDSAYDGALGALVGFIGLSLDEALLKFVDGFEFKSWLLKILTKGSPQ